MPDGFRVAQGYIEVDPDMTGFADKVRAELDKEDNHVKVPLDIDDDGFREKLRLAIDEAKVGQDVKVPIKMDDSDISSIKNDFKKLSTDLHSDATGAGSSLGEAISQGLSGALAGGLGGGASAAEGASGEGGGIGSILQGTIIGGLVLWGASVLPAIVPTVFGGFIGAAGAYLAIEGDAKLKASLGRVMTNLKRQLTQDASVFIQPIYELTKGLGATFAILQPTIQSTFKDSVPYLQTFVHTLEDFAMIILPPLNQMLKEFTPYLPEMEWGFIQLAQGLGAFMHNLGPGMKSSSEIFANSMKLLGGLIGGLGTAFALTANGIMESSHDIRVAWDAITTAFDAMRHDVDTGFDAWRHDMASEWDGISSDATNIWRTLWNTTIGEFTQSSSSLRNDLRSWGSDLESDWHAFDDDLTSGWDTFWRDTIGEFTSSSSSLRTDLRNWGEDLKSDWNSFTGTIRTDWDGFWRDVENDATGAVSRVTTIVKGIGSAFTAPVHIAEGIWDDLAKVWNSIANKLGLSKDTLPTYAVGGIIPGGYNGPPRDEQVIRVSGGESVLNQGATGALGPNVINYLNKAFAYPGAVSTGSSFAAGGIPGLSTVEKAADAVGHAASSIVGGAIDITKFMANPLSALDSLVKDIGGGVVGDLLTSLIKQVPQAIVNTLLGAAEGGGAGGTGKYTGAYGSGVAQWRPDVLEVLAMLGLPASLASQVLYQMQTESGGNPNAINLSDSNAAAGDPSRGLLQTIMSTFEAYRSSSLPNDIYNPLANIYAAVHYAEEVYGPSLMRGGMGMGSGHGYANGGSPAAGEFAVVGEEGPELVQFGAGATVYSNKASGQIINDASKGPLIGNFTIVQQEVGTTAEVMQALTYTLKNAALTATSARR